MSDQHPLQRGAAGGGYGPSTASNGPTATSQGASATGHGPATTGHELSATGHGSAARGNGQPAAGHGSAARGNGQPAAGHASTAPSHAHPTVDAPWPVAVVNTKIRNWIERLGAIWIEGQLTQINVRANWGRAYMTLRDVSEASSIQLTVPLEVIRRLPQPLKDGDRVVVYGRPSYYTGRGQLSIAVTEIRLVGIGELLARIALLRQQLIQEGLTDPARKKPLPLLPRVIGLVTGRGSDGERDVLSVARDRWPDVQFRVIHTAVQGERAVPQVVDALHELDRDPEVEVIIIARGGGSVEDLLPFSDERLVREVAAAYTPVVSAIGHDADHPLLDDVADLRAATPTDAAKRVVLDVVAELAMIDETRDRARMAIVGWIERERRGLAAVRERPVMADPTTPIRRMLEEVDHFRSRLGTIISHRLQYCMTDIAGLRARAQALGPSATLARGYAIVQVKAPGKEPEIATSIKQSPPGSQLRIRLVDGSITAAAMGVTPAS